MRCPSKVTDAFEGHFILLVALSSLSITKTLILVPY